MGVDDNGYKILTLTREGKVEGFVIQQVSYTRSGRTRTERRCA